MSKFAFLSINHRARMASLCAAVIATLLSPSALAATGGSDSGLQRSDRLDTGRIGKLTENERSVLRIEWRAAKSSADEAETVQAMLDKLQRLETTISEISRLILSMPAQQPGASAVTKAVITGVEAESDTLSAYDWRLWVANITAAFLVALWWFRGRRSSEAAPTGAISVTPSSPAIPVAVDSVATTPVITPAKAAGPATEAVPTPNAAAAAASAPPMAATRLAEIPDSAADAAPPEPTVAPMVIDFSLEEADPETIARENARVPRPRSATSTKVASNPEQKNLEPTLQLAEIMLSMGLDQGAAEALLDYTEAHPRQAVYHWLKLLGIYRRRGQQHEFQETAEKLRKHFNIQAEEWVRADNAEAPELEKFTRVAVHIQQTWLQPAECMSYLRQLLEDNREGARAGFPQSVAEEILLLIEIQKDHGA
ncbi:MAG: hypothetical protein K9K30_04650 [Burkholderiaceae bacterium]|nr:hypothetical protein [Sulfuritalea sp.]MCF8174513.1 hypothetical protein [Burkholderiaceae bacterium]MCF8184836.1 hypothetical protein [Polynucleobacter sp.]